MSERFDLSDYNTVPERMVEAHSKYPEGSFQAELLTLPPAFADKFIGVKARFFRTPDDSAPGEGLAWEPVPGKTPYTRDSELQNAETSAWGRALLAAFAADARKGVASREEVRNRQEPTSRSRRAPRSSGEADSSPVEEREVAEAAAMRTWVSETKKKLSEAFGDKELARQKYEEILKSLRLDPTRIPGYGYKEALDSEFDTALAELELRKSELVS